ncbi:hypothetical protein SASPL_106322 [Salvia splendens]|uniref:Disease resistance R13L4/SHOC-2-like LRR domain-containing protein n=1 Tax=Salvia splendens TaxID=180675 RepID=A0A8X9AA55_SALSN|nr:hypothetical protein SASPL_106322 [Salvia splendens]
MEESEQQHYVDFYSGSRCRRTCWDLPSRTSSCRVGEIRAPPLPEPPPQPVPEPELFYGPTHRGTSDTPESKHTTRPSFGPRGFLHADSDVSSRFPPSAYTGQQREHPQTRNRHLHPTFPSPRTPAHPQLVLDLKPPLQHVLDQQPQPSHRRAAAPPAPAAALSPPLHMDQQLSPSCGHPTTHLRQAEACLELSTTVKQPLLQRPPSCLRSPSLHSATKLVSCEEKYLGIEGDAKVLNQVDLRLNEKKLVDDEVRAIEVDKIDDDDGLHDSTVDSLQQTLLLILQRHDHLITPPVKQQLISIHDKAVVLQFNLKHFPDKETIREVANTAEKIIQYLFSSQNLSDCGFIHPTVRLSDQLGKLAKELESTVGYVVDYCKSNGASDSPAVSSSSRYALKSEVQDLKVAPELIVRLSIRLRRLTEKIKSTARASVDENPSDSPSIPPFTYNDVVLKPTSKDLVVGFDEDVVPMRNRIIGHNDTTSIEVVAEKCLEDLIKQSLVLVTSRKSNGRTKTCRLHSMVRDFCVRKAGQEKFLLSVTDYFPNPILRRHFLPQVLQNHHRVSVSWHDLLLKDSTHSSCTTSIMCIPQRGYRPKCSVENFTSLRVLHVLRENDHSYWELGHVFELIHLTYLASYIPDSIVPPAIAKLQNLQTLIIYRSEVRLPVEIWSLRQLRHLIAFSFCSLPLPEGVTLSLENLQTLSMATNFVCSGRMVRMIPNIKKLEICYSQENFGVGNYLDNLIQLHKLEKLKLEMHSSSVTGLNTICHPFLKLKVRSSFVSYLDNLVFPPSLIKLELSGGWISWKDMTIIGSLPNLQVLKLKNYACHGEYWETIKGEFCHLMVLLVEESNLQRWTTECSHFPRLRCLMLHRCPYLNEIPSDIGDIPTLKLIEIDDHNQSLLCSAKIIQEDQHKYFRNYRLKVVVKHS